MIKAFEVMGTTAISVQDGEELGSISRLITDRSGSTVALVLEQRTWHDPARVIPYSSVLAISKDAVLVENASSVFALNEVPQIRTISETSPELLGLPVLSMASRPLGIVTGYAIDEKTGKIVEYTIGKPGENAVARTFGPDRVVSIGKKILIVSED